jgi:hypothetical protein
MKEDEVLHLLENADWKSIAYKLTHYALWRSKQYSWKTGSYIQLPGGITPEDIACGAIEKVMTGTRKWDPERYPNLLLHLKWIVDSDLEHLLSSSEHEKITRISEHPQDAKSEDCESVVQDIASPLQKTILNPEEDLVARENHDFENKMMKELYDLVSGDDDLETLLLCFDEGIDKAEFIVAKTGWDIAKVYILKRKLLRKAEKINRIIQQGEKNEQR